MMNSAKVNEIECASAHNEKSIEGVKIRSGAISYIIPPLSVNLN
jgi:hypothetical protein